MYCSYEFIQRKSLCSSTLPCAFSMAAYRADRQEDYVCLFFFLVRQPQWAMTSSLTRFLDHTQRRTIIRRSPLEKPVAETST
jgi:hypothetical protein